jgi:hypothetical protein
MSTRIEDKWPHGYSCWCPTCAPIHKADDIRNTIDVYRKSDCAAGRLVAYIDKLESELAAQEIEPQVLTASAKCPLCRHEGPHPHTPLEQVIYRNGIKAGKAAAAQEEAEARKERLAERWS